MALRTRNAAATVAGETPAAEPALARRYVEIVDDCLVAGVHTPAGSVLDLDPADPALRTLLGSRAREIDLETYRARRKTKRD